MESNEAKAQKVWNCFRVVALVCCAPAVLFWAGVIDGGPFDIVVHIMKLIAGDAAGDVNVANPLIPSGLTSLLLTIVGGTCWLILPVIVIGAGQRWAGIIHAGSVEAYTQAQREAEERAKTPQRLGELVSVSNSKGGLLSSSESLVETTSGFYRVSGLIGGVTKGDPVHCLHDRLTIGPDNARRTFTIIE